MRSAKCPYCEARFLYSGQKKNLRRRSGVCPHCGKEYCVSHCGTAVFLLCAAALLVLLNFGLLSVPDMNLPFLCFVTAAGVAAAYFLLPLSVRFRRCTK